MSKKTNQEITDEIKKRTELTPGIMVHRDNNMVGTWRRRPIQRGNKWFVRIGGFERQVIGFTTYYDGLICIFTIKKSGRQYCPRV